MIKMPYKDINKKRKYDREHSRKWYLKYKKEVLTKQKEYRYNHKKEISFRKKEYYNHHKEEISSQKKEYHLMIKYGLSMSDFNNLLLAQNNRCAICNEPLDLTNSYRIHIDHNHLTGKVRGILCNKCNLAIGLLRDNPEYTKRATEYLERNNNEK